MFALICPVGCPPPMINPRGFTFALALFRQHALTRRRAPSLTVLARHPPTIPPQMAAPMRRVFTFEGNRTWYLYVHMRATHAIGKDPLSFCSWQFWPLFT